MHVMTRQLLACAALVAAAASATAQTPDARARCEAFSGQQRTDCMQQAAMSSTPSGRTVADIRAEARAAYATPADRCHFITTNRRLDCLQQYGRAN